MKLLFISTTLPFPPNSGGKVKSYHMLKYLNSNYELAIATTLYGDDVKWVKQFQDEFQTKEFIAESIDCPRTVINLIISYLQNKTLNEYRHWSNSFYSKLSPQMEIADCIIADHYEMMQYIPTKYYSKVILHTHNAEHLIWKRFSELDDQSWARKVVLALESSRIAQKEKIYCNKVKRVLASPNDRIALEQVGIKGDNFGLTYHLGDESQLQLQELDPNKTVPMILFIGTLTWEPNIDGLLWFLENCWSAIKEHHPDVKLVIGGKSPDQRLLKWAEKDSAIAIPGFIKDPEEYLTQARVFIAPLRFGSGMKVKVLNAMYRGIPTVTTDIGIEGLEVEDGVQIAIGNEPAEFTSRVSRLLTDNDYWNQLKNASRSLAGSKYTWQEVFKELDFAITDVVDSQKKRF
ncbi:glycosyltransferase [Xenococcus sp. PCC 7305]|uniref:glycosyltransferase n=1 Tax=Xenococcus sp. PCC 7305 TaxID=102125 RepID=UPI0002ABD345|nr:glycosyltransferase [Xenococcus sp. PCC 7305]ELS02333.1 glycosyltransferase [Xenococcus sp. PCC 7305]